MMRVRGPVNPRRLSEAATAALESGDIDALLAVNRAEFGGFRMMADDDDDDDDDNDDDDTDGDDDDDDAGKKDKSQKDKSGSDDDDDGKSELQRQLEQAREHKRQADKKREKAERELRELQDKDKPELERAQSALEEVTTERDNLKKEVSDLRLQNAFLTANSITWHDPDTALALAQSKGFLVGVVDGDDGSVDRKALKKALERLSKEHKYLVKSEKEDKGDDEPPGPSGEPAGGRSDNSKDEAAKRQQLKRRFPVLNR